MIFDINLFQGDAYVPQSELVSIVANVYRTRLSHALAVSNATHTNGSHTGPLHWKKWTFSTVWNFYFQNISRVFLEYFHTTENISIPWNWTKLWKLDFPTFFYNISKIFPYCGRGLFFSSASEREMGIGLPF